jgi:hypothetical protein
MCGGGYSRLRVPSSSIWCPANSYPSPLCSPCVPGVAIWCRCYPSFQDREQPLDADFLTIDVCALPLISSAALATTVLTLSIFLKRLPDLISRDTSIPATEANALDLPNMLIDDL